MTVTETVDVERVERVEHDEHGRTEDCTVCGRSTEGCVDGICRGYGTD